MCKVRTGILLFLTILMIQVPLSAGAGNLPGDKGQPEDSVEKTEEAGEENLPGDGALTGDVTPGDGLPGDLLPEDGLPGDLLPGEIITPEDILPEDSLLPEEPSQSADGKGDGAGMLTIVGIICVVAAIAAVGIAAWAISRKSGQGNSRRPKAGQQTGSGIPVQLEVYAGKCRNRTAFLELSDCLTIGSSSDCDIIFDDPAVAPLHSRIRLAGNQVYIEDLGTPCGTALDGMRIQGQNRLRGGEVISIGPVEFSVIFPQSM